MGFDISNEEVIATKIEAFKAGLFDVLVLSEKQKQALCILTDDETDELLYGGAKGGAKSWIGCEWLLWSCLSCPETRWFIGRHHLSQIRESTIQTFRKVCKKHNIPQSMWKYNDQSVHIAFANGSTITSIELMHKPGDFEFDAFGSTEYTGGWIEEGGGVAYKAYEVAGTIIGRHYNDKYGIRGKLLVTGNPSRNWQYSVFYKPARANTLPKERKFIQAFVYDNPFVDSGYIERLEKLTGRARQRLLLGEWDFINDPLALIDPEAIQDLFTNDYLSPNPLEKYLVLDIAMRGKDLLRGGVFYGDVLVDHDQMPKSGGLQVLQFSKNLQLKHNIPAHNIIFDSDGVGGFLGGDGGFIPGAIPFHANATPFILNRDETKRDGDKDKKQKSEYAHLKDQCGYLLAYDINEGKMWAKAVTSPEDVEMLSEELAQIKAHKDVTDDQLRLMPKELIVQALGRSPDFSDLFLMKKYFDLKKLSIKKPFKRPVRAMG